MSRATGSGPCGACRAANHEVRLEDLDGGRDRRAVEAPEQQPGRPSTELEGRLADDRDPGVDHLHPGHVVEADERDVPGDAQAAPAEHPPRLLGERVVRGEYRAGRALV